MTTIIIPPINTKGIFRFKKPVDTKIPNNIIYTVISVRSLHEIIDDDIDPFETIYVNLGLTEDDYKNDLDNGIPIVGLIDDAGNYYYIPASFILSIPDVTGVLYVEKGIAISLGQLPKDLDIQFIVDEIKSLIESKLGVSPAIVTEELSNYYNVDPVEAKTREANRIANVTDKETCYSKLKKLEDTLQLYKDKIKAIVKYINNS